jgi:hypothetical protein
MAVAGQQCGPITGQIKYNTFFILANKASITLTALENYHKINICLLNYNSLYAQDTTLCVPSADKIKMHHFAQVPVYPSTAENC